MKNFTKQNFKTNPLWIRLLIMAFMLLAGTSSAWAVRTIYLVPGVWETAGAWYAAWIYGGGVTDAWYTASPLGDGTYKFENVPDAATTMILTRQQSSTTYGSPNWSPWNRIDGISLSEKNKDLYSVTDWSAGSWSTYCNVTLSVSKSPDANIYLTSEFVTLTATATNQNSITWKEGDTTLDTGNSYTYTPNEVGNVTIKAIAENTTCSAEEEVTLSFVNQKKIVVKCKGADNIHLYTWNGTNDDGTKTWPGATTSTKDGEYYVWEISTESPINILFNKGGDNPKTKDINGLQVGYEYVFTWSGNHDASISLPTPTELPKPCTKPDKPSIELSTNSICNGDNTQVRINVTGDADTYALYVVNNGYTKQSNEAVNNKFTVSPTKTTTYVVKAFNGTCASDNYSDEVTVEVSTKPNITLTEESTAICKGDELDLSDFETSSVNLTWWNGETQITAPVSPETNTTYTVKAINGACTVTKDFPVTVNALPNAPGLENSASSQCVTANGTVDLNTLASPVGTVYWYDSSSQLISNATVSIATAGTFTYTAKAVSKGCESTSGTSFELTVKYNANASNYSIKAGSESKDYTGSELGLTKDEIVVSNNAGTVSTIYFKQNGNTVTPINVGDYEVYVTTAATDDICAGDIKIGTFTITKTTQAALYISNEQVKYCGLPAQNIVLTTEGGTTDGNVTFISSDEDVAIIVNNNQLRVIKEGSVNITATMAGNDNYEPITSEAKQFTFYKAPEKPTASQVVNIQQCKNGFTNGKIVINNVEPGNELDKYEYTINPAATGNAKDGFVISNTGDYVVTVTRTVDGCTMQTNSDPITVETDDNTPDITNVTISGDAEVCINTGTTLTCNVTAENYDNIAYLWSNGATEQSIQTGDLAENKTFTVTVTATKNETCPVTDVKDFNIQVKPISEPTIQATAISGINSIELSIKVQNAGCAKNYTLGYRIKQFNDAEFGANQIIASATSENKVTTQIEGLVTGVEYIIEAYIINGYNNNEVFYSEPVTCTVLASEDCVNPSADYVEILGPNDDKINLYAFDSQSGATPLSGWPGSTRNTWYEVNSIGYSVWKIYTSEPVYLIFNKDGKQTADLKGPDDEGHKPGYRYIYDVDTEDTWNISLSGPTLIAEPEVETVSATPERINTEKSNVTLVGRLLKTGCADIKEYGFQYKLIDDESYTTVNAGTSNDIAIGETFTKTIELTKGTYQVRARVENVNGYKVYGEVFRVTIAERDLTIAAVHKDTDVDTETYYDFVGLYMSSITKPTNVEITSYTWYKDGEVYNPTINESSEYGATYINSNGSNNIRPNEIGTYKLKVQLSNGDIFESNEIEVSKASKVNASSILNASNRTLPVISVRTNKDFPTCKSGSYPSAQADDLKKKRSVDVKIFDKEGKLYYDRKARMNYRGSSSLNFVKKSYAFCPGDEMCGDVEKGLDYVITKKVNMFNLGAEDKDWVLYAAAADPSLMRNRIVFDTYSAMTNKWGVKSMYVELIVDGEYKGVYVFMDKITNNPKRVNITAVDGFIVKFDKTDTADRYVDGKQEDGDEKTFMTERTGRQGISTYGTTVDQMFEIEYPEKDDNKGTWNNIVASIKEKFEAFETALAEGKYAKVREIIDYDSWADWFIINEYIKNQDAYRASCIFVYNGEKIEARPLWDQELSMNNTCRTSNGSSSTDGLLIENEGMYTDCFPAPFWFTGRNAEFGSCGGDNGESSIGTAYTNYLLKDGCFIGLVQQKLAAYLKAGAALDCSGTKKTDGTIENAGTLLSLAVKFNGELTATKEGATTYKSAQAREAEFWEGKSRGTADGNGGDTGYVNQSYSTEYGNLTNWIVGDRDEKITSKVGGMTGEMSAGISITTSPANAIVTPWIPITVTVNVSDNAEYIYDDSAITEGITVDVDKAITSKSGNVYKYTFPRPSDWGTDNVYTPIQQIIYPINAKLKVYETTCPGLSNEAGIYIKLKDEGNDICVELVEQ